MIFCGQNNAIGGISGVENIYLRNNSHDLQVFGASEFFNIYNETDNIKNHPQEENAFFIHIVNSKTAPVFHKTFDWGTGEFENEMERSGAVLTELELYIRHQMRKVNGKIFLFRLVHRQ